MNLILYLGLDVHNDSMAVSIAPSDATEVRRWGRARRHPRLRGFPTDGHEFKLRIGILWTGVSPAEKLAPGKD